METIFAMLWVAMALFVLFETSSVYEYFKVLRIPNCISRLKEYSKYCFLQEFDGNYLFLSYGQYLRQHHDTFLVRWATCPYCIGVALSVAASFAFSKWQEVPITYLGGILCYRLFTIANRWLGERSGG